MTKAAGTARIPFPARALRLLAAAGALVAAAGAGAQPPPGLTWTVGEAGPGALLKKRFPAESFRRAEQRLLARWPDAPQVVAYVLAYGTNRPEHELRAWVRRLSPPPEAGIRQRGLRALAFAAAARALEDVSFRRRAAFEAREAARLWEAALEAGRVTAPDTAWAARALAAAGLDARARELLEFAREHLTGPSGAYERYDPAEGQGVGDGDLEANALLGLVFLEAARAAGDRALAGTGLELARLVWSRFRDPKVGGFFARNAASAPGPGGGPVFVPEKPLGPNASAALLMVRAGQWTGEVRYREAAARTVVALRTRAADAPDGAGLLAAYRELAGISPGPARPAFLPLLALSFLAGVLGVLSPCTLPVLPAYFAFAAGSGPRQILVRTVSFFVGLALSFSAMGASAGLAGRALGGHLPAVQRLAGAVIAALGVASLLGRGFTGLRFRDRPATTTAGSFVLGLAFSVGWTACVGPILAAVLVLAATREGALAGGVLLFVFAMGLGLPLTALSLAMARMDRNSRLWRLLRGRAWQVRLGRRTLHLHSTGLLSGALLIGLGLLVATGRLAALNRVLPLGPAAWLAGLEERLLAWWGR